MDPSFRLELGRRALLGDHVLANLAQHLGQLFGHLLGPLCLAFVFKGGQPQRALRAEK